MEPLTLEEKQVLARSLARKYGFSTEAFLSSLNLESMDEDAILAAAKSFSPGGAASPEVDPNAPTPITKKMYSPFDSVFRKYAGEFKNDDTFIAVVAAGTLAESGWDPTRQGDNGKSVGLFQMHEAGEGAGMSVEARSDPDTASKKMVPKYAAAYREGKLRGLTGGALASYTAAMAERPSGYEDPNSAARKRYESAFYRISDTTGVAPSSGPDQFTPPGLKRQQIVRNKLTGLPEIDPTTGKPLTIESDVAMGGIRPLPEIFGKPQDAPLNELLRTRGQLPQDLTKSEGAYYFPFATPEYGGQSQAVSNILRTIGLNPSLGNPMTRFMTSRANDASTLERARMLSGGAERGNFQNPLEFSGEGKLAQNVLGDLRSGEIPTSGILESILGAFRGRQSGAAVQPSQLEYLQGLEQDPKSVAELAGALIRGSGGVSNPKSLQESILSQYSDYRNAQALNPGMSFFEYLFR